MLSLSFNLVGGRVSLSPPERECTVKYINSFCRTPIHRDLKRRMMIAIALGGFCAPIFSWSCSGATETWEQFPAALPLPKPLCSGYAPVNGVQLYYAIYGRGKALILLHGGLGNIEHFGNQIPAFANDFEVIAVDSRGHGKSTRTNQSYSYSLMASDIVALMDYLDIPKASLLGWSDGANIGLDIAIHHPARINALVAFAGNFAVSGLRKEAKPSSTFNQYFELVKRDYRRLSSTPTQYKEFEDAVRKMWRTQPNYSPQQLASIRCPTLVIDGAYDEAIKRSHTEQMSHFIPNSQLVILPDVSHFAMFQNPAEFNEVVLEFLKSITD
jgi:pimeloyl-ACP methyl ester carboxylesterase